MTSIGFVIWFGSLKIGQIENIFRDFPTFTIFLKQMEEITSKAPTTEEDIDPMVEITTEFPNYLVDYEVRNCSRFFQSWR